ncbi:sodium channel protein Nach [Manduca sexta]|uniref:sodium channel protein Nach n=1 Tax=Manduca sexta TaxID=7130 RepID=UPI00188E4CE8|nr:sodium channel protein Nach [Manduca sexta]
MAKRSTKGLGSAQSRISTRLTLTYHNICVYSVIWLLCCCASACCAGVLCGVFWARFLKVPALLALYDVQKNDPASYRLPVIAVCPAIEAVTELFIGKLTSNETLKKQLPKLLAHALNGKPSKKDHLYVLDQLLANNNVTLNRMMFDHMPPCREVMQKCRWQTLNVPCEDLFQKEITNSKICCVMRSNEKLINSNKKAKQLASQEVGQKMEFALQCSNGSTLYGCEFFTKYGSEVSIDPEWLTPGNNYIAQLRFVSVPESTVTEKLVEESCNSVAGYSLSDCLHRCAENFCGCADPLRDFRDNSTNLPPCPIARLSCLQTNGLHNNGSCNCLPSCKKITTYMTLESGPMKFIEHAIDPIYRGLNVTSSVVMSFRVNIHMSKEFILNPTETWLTLLSSLGGVFNMFLGVGLFSALELLTLIFVKIPMAIRKYPEKPPPQIKTR